MKKRLVSILLALTLLITCLPQFALPAKAVTSAFERDKQIYKNNVLNNTRDITSFKSAMIDFDGDGIYELVSEANINDAGHITGSYLSSSLETIQDGSVKTLLSAYNGYGTSFSQDLKVRVDTSTGKPVLLLSEWSGDREYSHTSTVVYTVQNGEAVEIASIDSYTIDKDTTSSNYQKMMETVKKETSLYTYESWYFLYYIINGKYVSKEDYEARYTEPTNEDWILKDGTADDPIPYTNKNQNPVEDDGKKAIIVIPGITGSELYSKPLGIEEKVWFGIGILDSFLGILSMDLNGNPIGNVYTNDESKSPYGTLNTYESLVQELKLKYAPDNYDVRFFSYDWRKTNTNAAEELNAFIENNHYTKVILVAHSMGGIVASLYIANYGSAKIEKLITLGTPFYGAPKALGALVSGEFLDGKAKAISVDNRIIKKLVLNMPGVYQLLPSKRYFENGNYYVESPKKKGYSYNETTQFMKRNSYLDSPVVDSLPGNGANDGNLFWYNSTVHEQAESVLSSLDKTYGNIINGEINTFVIVGDNVMTASCYGTDVLSRITDVFITERGDGTVPIISSTFNNAKMKRSPYYVDGISHTNLASDVNCLQLIKNIIDGKGDTLEYAYKCEGAVYHDVPIPERTFGGYKFVAACPVNLRIYDSKNNYIGSFEDGNAYPEEGYENNMYLAGNDNDIKIAYLEGADNYSFEIDGYETGEMTFSIEQYYNDSPINKAIYDHVPITEDTRISVDVQSDEMLVDDDNDGSYDEVLTPSKEQYSCTGGSDCPGKQFADMPVKGNWAHDAIDWAVVNEITNGIDATHFGPDRGCTRGQVVTFLWRAAGCPEPNSTYNPFADVYGYAFYYKAVLWAVENGITNGLDKNHFGPDRTCTRGQIVTFLYRYNHEPERKNCANPFTDVEDGQFFYDPVLWALESGVTKGTSEIKFSPGSTCTRAQVMTFLYRSCEPPSTDTGNGLPSSFHPSDLRSVHVEDVTLFQNANLYTDEEGNSAYYYEDFMTLALTFADGSTYTCTPWELWQSPGFQFSCSDDQQAHPWGLGSHTATAEINGIKTPFRVTVIESPVKSVKISPVTIYENVDCYSYGDGESYYNPEPTEFTVTMKDGTVCNSFGDLYDYCWDRYGRYPPIDFGSIPAPIQTGKTYTVSASIFGMTASFSVLIKPDPIKRLSMRNLTILEGTNGYWSETDAVYGWQYYYDFEGLVLQELDLQTTDPSFDPMEHGSHLLVTMADGSSIWENQTAHPWKGGNTYSLMLSYAGKTCQFNLRIEKTPVRSVSIVPVERWQNAGQSEITNFYGDSGSSYRVYDLFDGEMTVRLSDGSTITGDQHDVAYALEQKYAGRYDGVFIEIQSVSDQSADNQWGLGAHPAFFGILGTLQRQIFIVIPNPIASVTAYDVSIPAYTHGSAGGYWDESSDEWVPDDSWYEYNFFEIVPLRIVFKDGTVYTGTLDELNLPLYDYSIQYYDDQSKQTPWGIGTHTCSFSFAGFDVTSEITIY